MQNTLFEPIKIKNTIFKNRFVMSAAADNLEKDYKQRIERFSKLAAGGVGLIITGGMREHNIDAWQNIVAAVHKNGGKIAVQLVSERGLGTVSLSNDDRDAIAVSLLTEDNKFFNSFIKWSKHHAATEIEIREIINSYGRAAAKVKAIGAGAVQIHAAHQNFLSQFLSPLTNKRTDQWGESIENRTRMHREVYKVVRTAVGPDFPILIKLGVQDAFVGGLQFNEGKIAAQIIAECGYDALEISQGLQDVGEAFKGNWQGTPMRTKINKITDEGYFREWCREIKKTISKPTIMTGGLRTYDLIKDIVENKETDFIGLCRPFVREPNLINRWQKGDHSKASCVSCNKCVTELLLKGLPLECYLDKN